MSTSLRRASSKANPIAPEAIGQTMEIEGFYNLFSDLPGGTGPDEIAQAENLWRAFEGINELSLSVLWWLSLILENALPLGKMVLSHKVEESVLYGLLHDDSGNWNVFDNSPLD